MVSHLSFSSVTFFSTSDTFSSLSSTSCHSVGSGSDGVPPFKVAGTKKLSISVVMIVSPRVPDTDTPTRPDAARTSAGTVQVSSSSSRGTISPFAPRKKAVFVSPLQSSEKLNSAFRYSLVPSAVSGGSFIYNL